MLTALALHIALPTPGPPELAALIALAHLLHMGRRNLLLLRFSR